MTMMVFGYLITILISIHFQFSDFSLVLVSVEKIYQILKTMFHHISKHIVVHQQYSATHHIFEPVLSVWK